MMKTDRKDSHYFCNPKRQVLESDMLYKPIIMTAVIEKCITGLFQNDIMCLYQFDAY